jgi:DNA-binding transcriptional ArsR family regulator
VVVLAADAQRGVSQVDQIFAALADPTRRSAVDLLRRRPHRAGELASALTLSPAAMSRHLRVLRRSGLVMEGKLEEDARVRVYRLRPERFSELRRWLDELETSWSVELEAFQAHVEGRGRRRR